MSDNKQAITSNLTASGLVAGILKQDEPNFKLSMCFIWRTTNWCPEHVRCEHSIVDLTLPGNIPEWSLDSSLLMHCKGLLFTTCCSIFQSFC